MTNVLEFYRFIHTNDLYAQRTLTFQFVAVGRWLTFPSQALALDVYRYTRVQAARDTRARPSRRNSIHFILGDICISFTTAYAFFPTPTTTR